GALALSRGLASAVRVFRRLRPRLVVGVGGYASVAGVMAARLSRVPVVLLEQNAIPGAANRALGRFARRICVGFAEAAAYFPAGRAVHTGNPVRPAVLAAPPGVRREGVGLLVFGGSQGAHHLNEATVAALELLASAPGALHITHQTGEADRVAVTDAYRRLGLAARVEAFVEDMGSAYAAADLVIARAGAMSCAEITAGGIPAAVVACSFRAREHHRPQPRILGR